jgi:hypothetical protein
MMSTAIVQQVWSAAFSRRFFLLECGVFTPLFLEAVAEETASCETTSQREQLFHRHRLFLKTKAA